MDPSWKGEIGQIYRISLKKDEQVEDMDFLQKGRTSQRYGISSKRKNKSKMWTFFRKEEQVEDMDYPRKGRTGRDYEPSSDKGGAG